MTMAAVDSARWIVCERTGRWALGLRREPAAAGLRLHEVRSLAECWEMLGQFSASFVVVELTAGHAPALLARLARWEREYPLARMAIVADRALGASEELMREAGAVWFTASPRELGPLAAIARQHLEQAPKPEMTVVERIWSGLPWGS